MVYLVQIQYKAIQHYEYYSHIAIDEHASDGYGAKDPDVSLTRTADRSADHS